MLALLFLCSALPAAFSVHAAANTPPVLSGTPAGTLVVGTAFFIPTARDANGDRLRFSISNRPSWAKFDARNGALQATPTATGKRSNIVIYVSDRKSTLAAYHFAVKAYTTTGVERANSNLVSKAVQ